MMNIKILNPIPEEEVLVTVPFGSQVYGTATEHSDQDFVKIIKQDCGQLLLQYQSDSQALEYQVDYVYTDTKNFFHLLGNGGNTVFFEAAHTPEFKTYMEQDGVPFDIMKYYSPRMAKAYLGLAKRDLDYPDRFFHVNRGIWLFEQVMEKNLIVLSDIAHVPKDQRMDVQEYKEVIKELRRSIKYE